MVYAYDAIITKEEDGGYFVQFPQLPDAFTQGATREEATERASEVLTMILAGILDDGGEPPRQERVAEVVSVCVDVTDSVVNATKCMTNAEAAQELGITSGRVSQLVKAGLLERAIVDGKPMVTIASVNRRKSNPPAGHRPRREAATA